MERTSAHHSHNSSKNIKTAFFLNLSFTIIEIVGGILTNSIAIIADALHDFGDSLTLGLSWYLEKFSQKKRSSNYSYGYKRFSLLSAFINSIILITGSFFILKAAIPRLLAPEPSNYTGMLFLSLLGIIVNGIAVLRLKKGHSLNEKVVSWHLLEDVFGWVAVLIVSITNMFLQIPILDPILAIIFTIIIFINVIKNIKQIISIFLQSTPSELSLKDIENHIKSVDNVLSVHDTHIWTMDGDYHVLTTHVVLNNESSMSSMQNIKCKIKNKMKSFRIQHTTIEFETENETCDYENC